MNLKKVILIVILISIICILGIVIFKGGEYRSQNNNKLKVVASNFACYDFLRAIIGDSDNIQLEFLLGPGKDSHSYDPTAQDLISIQSSDLFVYVGGEMENWSKKVLSSLNNTKKVICISEDVETIEEQEIDGAEEEQEEKVEGSFDEHIWTSPKNAILMIKSLQKALEEIDSENSSKYQENAKNYINEIRDIDNEIREIVNNKVRDRLIFADKMPMQYFINYYGLKVSAAFPGCSTDTEPSASTIAYLERKVKEENIPVVLYVELNDGRVAKIISDEAGAKCEAMQIQTMHNISKDDFENRRDMGKSYEEKHLCIKKSITINTEFTIDKKYRRYYNYINLVNCEEDGSKIKVASRDN